MFTKAQLEAYEGPNCPFCGSSDITGGQFDCDDHGAWQPVSCDACGKRWQDVYHRDRVADLQDPVYEEQPLPGKTNIDLRKVDWELLRKQKAQLFDLAREGIDGEDQPYAEGLLSLLDHLMDEAAKTLGEELVFGK